MIGFSIKSFHTYLCQFKFWDGVFGQIVYWGSLFIKNKKMIYNTRIYKTVIEFANNPCNKFWIFLFNSWNCTCLLYTSDAADEE